MTFAAECALNGMKLYPKTGTHRVGEELWTMVVDVCNVDDGVASAGQTHP